MDARAAVNGRIDGDPFPRRPFVDALPHFINGAGKLMTAGDRIRRDEIPLENVIVGPANPAALHLHDHFAGTR